MTSTVEPMTLRLPPDLLVLQSLHGHLDVPPVLLAPGMRCVIGSAADCAVRLTKSALVQSKHCVVEVIEQKTLLTEWVPETTWLNDRLVTEPTAVVTGDRISIGPFDFQVRSLSADELHYFQRIQTEPPAATDKAGDLRLEQEREAGSKEQDDSLLLELGHLPPGPEFPMDIAAEFPPSAGKYELRPLDAVPSAVRLDYEQVLQLLKAERDQLDHDRWQLASEQAQWEEQKNGWSQRLHALETQLADLEKQRQSILEERETCRSIAAELMRDEAQMAEWEARLRREEQEIASLRKELSQQREPELLANIATTHTPDVPVSVLAVAENAGPDLPVPAHWSSHQQAIAEPDVGTKPGQSLQTLLTLIAFGLAAVFLSGRFGDQEVYTTLGWGTATLGAISTADLLLRRCFSISY